MSAQDLNNLSIEDLKKIKTPWRVYELPDSSKETEAYCW